MTRKLVRCPAIRCAGPESCLISAQAGEKRRMPVCRWTAVLGPVWKQATLWAFETVEGDPHVLNGSD